MKLRFKITSKACPSNIAYIVVNRGKVSAVTKSLKKVQLNSMTEDAAELQFALEDVTDSANGVEVIKKFLGKTKEVVAI